MATSFQLLGRRPTIPATIAQPPEEGVTRVTAGLTEAFANFFIVMLKLGWVNNHPALPQLLHNRFRNQRPFNASVFFF
jgi:hypothetical protein